MKSYLTGNPEIRLALNEDLSIGRNGSSIYGIFLISFLLLNQFFLVKHHLFLVYEYYHYTL